MKINKDFLYKFLDTNFKRFQPSKANHFETYFKTPCVYLLLNDKEVVYVGQSKCLMQRLNDHYKSDKIFTDYIFFIHKGTEKERIDQESRLIFYFNPIYNIKFPFSVKEAYLKSFYRNCNIYFRYGEIIKQCTKFNHVPNWKDDLKCCIDLLEQTLIKNTIIYSNDKFFIKKFNIFCSCKSKNTNIDSYELLEFWEKLYKFKKEFNFTLVFKSLDTINETIKI